MCLSCPAAADQSRLLSRRRVTTWGLRSFPTRLWLWVRPLLLLLLLLEEGGAGGTQNTIAHSAARFSQDRSAPPTRVYHHVHVQRRRLYLTAFAPQMCASAAHPPYMHAFAPRMVYPI